MNEVDFFFILFCFLTLGTEQMAVLLLRAGEDVR